ncbi:MAG: hypothetical protein WKG07_06550 [Hymenobacter sp.]
MFMRICQRPAGSRACCCHRPALPTPQTTAEENRPPQKNAAAKKPLAKTPPQRSRRRLSRRGCCRQVPSRCPLPRRFTPGRGQRGREGSPDQGRHLRRAVCFRARWLQPERRHSYPFPERCQDDETDRRRALPA